MNVNALYDLAEKQNIDIVNYNDIGYLSLSSSIDGIYVICTTDAMLESTPLEKVCLSHEIGHCMTGSFYNSDNPLDVIGKHERKATVWAIKNTISEDELAKAFEQGYTEIWELAEYFEVTEGFMREAVNYYYQIE